MNLKEETGHPSMEVSLFSQHSDAFWRGLTPVIRVKSFTDCPHTPKTDRISAVSLWLDSGFIARVYSKQSQAACILSYIVSYMRNVEGRQITKNHVILRILIKRLDKYLDSEI